MTADEWYKVKFEVEVRSTSMDKAASAALYKLQSSCKPSQYAKAVRKLKLKPKDVEKRTKHKNHYRRWTDWDDVTLVEMYFMDQYDIDTIAHVLQRSATATGLRIEILLFGEAYDARTYDQIRKS